jgi:hypothetical protein
MSKKRFKPKHKRYPDKNQQALNERNDDQIAPRAVSHSIDALQRWAFATANIAQSGYRANEVGMIERVRERYEVETPSLGANVDDELHAELARSDQALRTSQSRERDQPVSHAGFSDRSTAVSHEGFEADLHKDKRRRVEALGAEDVEMSDGGALSSEWHLASENKVETSNKVTKTRTIVDLTGD